MDGTAAGGVSKTIVKLFGGQGAMNVNPWSPDSRLTTRLTWLKKAGH